MLTTDMSRAEPEIITSYEDIMHTYSNTKFFLYFLAH